MEFKVVTLRYSPALGVIDDAPLVALAREHELCALREHFFLVHDVPHLLCVVSYQRRVTQPTAHEPAPAQAAPTASATTIELASSSPSSTAPPGTPTAGSLTADQHRLYEAIRRWRYETARRDGVPPYVVLTNRNITDLVRERPDGLAALRRVPGIGQAKVERHGEALLALLRCEPPGAGPGRGTAVDPTDDPASGESLPVESAHSLHDAGAEA